MKKAYRILILTIALSLSAVILLVAVADPFFHFHAPLNMEGVYLYNEVYQDPGEAKNFSYDTVMLGTSMTENYRVSWFEEYGEHAVKLSYSGAKTANIEKLLDVVFSSGNEVKKVYIDLNDYQLSNADPAELFGEVPEYLYDGNILTDVQYVFNKDVFFQSFDTLKRYVSKDGNLDEAFTWGEESLFGRDKVLEDLPEDHTDEAWVNTSGDTFDLPAKGRANAEVLLSYVKTHPETEFVFFYPPYSIAYWVDLRDRGELDNRLSMYLSSMETLATEPNATLYFFMDDLDTITDLDNYRDMCHYRPEINYKTLKEMHADSFKVDVDRMPGKLEAFRSYIVSYELN